MPAVSSALSKNDRRYVYAGCKQIRDSAKELEAWMSKMACLCGGTIRDHQIPCPTEGWILRDQDQEAYYDEACRDIVAFFGAVRAERRDAWIADYFSPQYPAEVSDEGIVHDILCLRNRPVFLSVAECEQCGRLWVQREPDVNSYRSYAPDEPGYAGVLLSRAARRAEPRAAPDGGRDSSARG